MNDLLMIASALVIPATGIATLAFKYRSKFVRAYNPVLMALLYLFLIMIIFNLGYSAGVSGSGSIEWKWIFGCCALVAWMNFIEWISRE